MKDDGYKMLSNFMVAKNEKDREASILLMEDDPIVRRSMVAYLDDCGYKVTKAKDGREGLDLFGRQHFDLILVDLMMPNIDGFRVLGQITHRSPLVPTIVISGTGVVGDVVEALRLGAWDFLQKPLEELAILRHAVERCLERAHMIRELQASQRNMQMKVKQRTRHLHEANRLLEEEVERRRSIQRENESLIAELKTKNIELEQFSHTTAHDMRTPLITIQGYNDLLRLELAETATQDAIRYISGIGNASEKMYHLLDDVLRLAKLGKAAPTTEKLPFGEVIDAAIHLLDATIQEHRVEIHVDANFPVVRGNRIRLVEVMQNLIDNAIKYTSCTPQPVIEIRVRQEEEGTVFSVSDNGVGLLSCHRKLIFDPFSQVDPLSPGSGVGLAIVGRVIQQHSGRIWVESKGLGHGTTFNFTLPLLENEGLPGSVKATAMKQTYDLDLNNEDEEEEEEEVRWPNDYS
jgi:signal transduction histidine kinase